MITYKHKLPGYIANGLLALATSLWTFWRFGKTHYEVWWGHWTNRLPYFFPMLICWIFAFIGLTWPRFGGWITFLVGGAFTTWRWILQARPPAEPGWAEGIGASQIAGSLFPGANPTRLTARYNLTRTPHLGTHPPGGL
jgi:hypothetical protein